MASLTITVPTPGPHDLWVYASDAGANDSGYTDGALSGNTTFVATGDPAVTCASFTDALANTCSGGSSAPNSMISKTSGTLSCGNGTGDGAGRQLDANDLTNAGWGSGSHVTIDGTSFTVPAYGACQADNVLAANQTIGMPGGSQGSAVVFLATSTNGIAATPGLTGTTDSGVLASDATVPAVPGGIGVTGGGCTTAAAEDANVQGCEPATGNINYAPGCPETSSPYYLTVPDWVTGPGDIAAVAIAHRDLVSGQQAADSMIFAFAAPTDPGCQIASVTLPDVGNTAVAQLASGVTYDTSALHIFGISVRNTTTATPEADGTSAAASAGQSWTGEWAGPVEDAVGPPSGSWGNQTLRIQTMAPVGGNDLRIRLSDPGFLATDGDGPLKIGHATIAVQSASGGPVPAATPQTLSFGAAASQSVTIPEGGGIYSNPVSLLVSAGQSLLVSFYLSNSPGSVTYLPTHGWSPTVEWVAAPAASGSSGDYSADTTGTPFTASGSFVSVNTNLLTGIDVTTAQTTADPGGIPTVSVLGDNLTDVNYNGFSSTAISFPITRVDGGLAAAEGGAFGVVDGGINSNEASADSAQAGGLGGVSAVARLDRDVLAEPDIGAVIIGEGLQDVLHGASEQQLEDAYTAMMNELQAFGVNVIVTTITPCDGYSSSAAGDSCSTAVDGVRTDVNQDFIGNAAPPYCSDDFDGVVSNGASPEALQTTASAGSYDSGDHINLTQAGYTALTGVITGGTCSLAANTLPPP